MQFVEWLGKVGIGIALVFLVGAIAVFGSDAVPSDVGPVSLGLGVLFATLEIVLMEFGRRRTATVPGANRDERI